MSALGSLVVKLALEYAQFTAGSDEAQKRADALAKGVQDRMDGMAASVKAAAAGVAGGLAAAFSIGAVDQLLKDVTASQAALKDLSHMAGMSVESLSALQSVGRYVGLGAQEIAEASVSMTDALAQAADESDGVGQALAAVGLKFEDFRRLKPEDQFKVLAGALSNYEDGAGKAAVMTQIMGEEGAKLLPFMRDLADAGELQAEVTLEQAEAAKVYQKNLADTQKAADAWKQEIASGMVPALNLATQALDEVINGTGGLRDEAQALGADGSIQRFTEAGITALSYLADAAQVAWRGLETVGVNLGGLAAAIVRAVQGDLKGAWQILQDTGQDMMGVWDEPTLGQRFRENMVKLKATTQETTEAVKKQTLAVENYGEESKAAAERQKQLDKAAQDAAKAAQRELEATTAARVKAYGEEVKAEEARLKALQGAAGKAKEAVQSARDEEEAHRRAAAAGITHAEAITEIAIARSEEAYQKALDSRADAETLLALHEELQARRELLEVMQQRGVREGNQRAMEEFEKGWNQVSQTVGQTLSDYIMGGGKDAAQYLKRLFSTLVLQPIVNYGVQGVMGALGMGGGSAVAGGGGGVMGLASNASSMYNMFSGGSTYASNFGMGLANTFQQGGGYLYTQGFETLGEGMASLGNTMATYSGAINTAASAVSYAAAIYALSEERFGTAIGTAVGTYFFGPIGGAVGGWIGGFLDDTFGRNPHEHMGGVYSTKATPDNPFLTADTSDLSEREKQRYALKAQSWDRTAVILDLGLSDGAAGDLSQRAVKEIDDMLGNTIEGIISIYDELSKSVDGAVRAFDISAAFATNPISTDQDAYAYLKIFDKMTGGLVYGSEHRDDSLGADVAVAWDKFGGEIAGVLVSELQAAGLAGWMSDTFEAQKAAAGGDLTLSGFQQALVAISQIDFAFNVLGQTMEMFAGPSDEMKTALLRSFGGIEGVTNQANSFYNAYYSEAERMEALSVQLDTALSALDLSIDPRMGDEAKAQFRAAVEAAFDLDDQALAVGLLSLSDSFAVAADYAEKAGGAFSGLSDVMRGLLEERKSLEAELLRAQGDAEGYTAALRAIATEGFNEAEIAAWDYNAALQEQIDALDAAAQARLAEVAAMQQQLRESQTYVTGLEQSLARITGTAAQSVQDVLSSLMGRVSATSAFRANLGTSIESAYRGTLSNDQLASHLRGQESALWSQLSVSDDPATVAQELQRTILDRISAESALREAVDGTVINSLQEQLSVAKSLSSVVSGMQSAVDGLRLGSDSALSPHAQLQYAQQQFESAAARAMSGDTAAWADVQSYGKSWVGLGRDVYASSVPSAEIFERVTGTMDQLIGMGVGADPQVAALETQITLLQSVSQSSEKSTWAAEQQLEAFTRLDSVMQLQQSRQEVLAQKQLEAAQEQIVQLKKQNDLLEAKIAQDAAIAQQQHTDAAAQQSSLKSLESAARLEAAQV